MSLWSANICLLGGSDAVKHSS